MKQTKHSIKSHRYELVHGEDADFIAYQRMFGDGLWQTRFKMDDPAYGVSVADLSWKPASSGVETPDDRCDGEAGKALRHLIEDRPFGKVVLAG